MSYTEGSLLCRLLLTLWNALRGFWGESILGRWCRTGGAALRRAGRTSAVWDRTAREGAMVRSWRTSLLGKVFGWIIDLPVTVCKGVYRLGKGLWEGSLLFRGITALGRRTWLLMGLFVLVMLVAPHERWDNLYAFLGASAVLGLFAIGCADRDARLEGARLGPYFAFYLIFITLGLVLSLNVKLSLRFYLFHLTCFFIAVVAVSAVERFDQLKGMLVCGAIGLTVAAVYGCYQGYIGVEVVASQQDLVLNAGMPGRIFGFFDNPNNFAEVLVMMTPLIAALTLNAKGWRGRVLGVLALGVSVAAIGMTYSRSSWLGLALAAVIMLGLMNWRFLPVLAVAAVCAIPLLPKSILNRILTIGNMQDSSARYRLAIWEDTARVLKDYGVTGVGLGSDVMKKVFHHYPTLYDGNYPIHTHNNYLQMWGEVGIFGLAAYLTMAAGHIKTGVKALRGMDKPLRRTLAAATGAFVGILSIGLVEYTWFYPRNMFLFWFLFAVIGCCIKLAGKGGEKSVKEQSI